MKRIIHLRVLLVYILCNEKLLVPAAEECHAIKQQFETAEKQYSQCSLIQALQTENAQLREKLYNEESKNQKLSLVGTECVTELVKGKRVMTIPTIYEGWIMNIDIKPLGPVAGWNTIIHFTASGDVDYTPGNRIPVIWARPDSMALSISNNVNGNGNSVYSIAALTLNEWTSIKLSTLQRSNGTYEYMIEVNGAEVYSVINTSAKVWNNVKVYHSHGSYGVASYLIKNFQFETKPEL